MVKRDRIIFRLFFALTVLLSIGGTVLTYILFANELDPKYLYIPSSKLFTCLKIIVFTALGLCVLVAALPIFRTAKKELSSGKIPTIILSSFCGCFILVYGIVSFVSGNESFSGVKGILLLITGMMMSLYFLLQIITVKPNQKAIAIFGLGGVIYLILYIFIVLYGYSDIIINSPLRIGGLLGGVSIMLFIMSEVRYRLEFPSPSMLLGFSGLAVVFGIGDSLPRILLSLQNINGFTISGEVLYLLFELCVGVYALCRMITFLPAKTFYQEESETAIDDKADENEEATAVAENSEVVASGDETAETTNEVNDDLTEEDQENTEEKNEKEESEEAEEQEETQEENSDEGENSDSDIELPPDSGFEEKAEEDFDLADFEAAKELPDNDLDDEGDQPTDMKADEFGNIEDDKKLIGDLIDELPNELEEEIDYEEIREKTSAQNIKDAQEANETPEENETQPKQEVILQQETEERETPQSDSGQNNAEETVSNGEKLNFVNNASSNDVKDEGKTENNQKTVNNNEKVSSKKSEEEIAATRYVEYVIKDETAESNNQEASKDKAKYRFVKKS